MSRVAGSAYGQREKLTPESLGGAERVAIQILDSGSFQRAKGRPGNGGFTYWISSQTPPDHILFLDGNGLRQIVEKLGDQTAEWHGKMVVLELRRGSYQGKDYEKYIVAPAAEWNDVIRPLAPAEAAKPKRKRKPKAKA